jgi:hypothetical protein
MLNLLSNIFKKIVTFLGKLIHLHPIQILPLLSFYLEPNFDFKVFQYYLSFIQICYQEMWNFYSKKFNYLKLDINFLVTKDINF